MGAVGRAGVISRSEPSPPAFCTPILFFLFLRKERIAAPGEEKKANSETGSANRAAIASEEASSIPFPPGRRKLHIRSLLLPSQIVTVSLGHNLAIWNFTTPHAILMMADRRNFVDTVCRGRTPLSARRAAHPKCEALRRDRTALRADRVVGPYKVQWKKNGGRECYSSFAQSKARWTARCQPWRRASRDFASSCGSNVRSTAQILRISA